MTFLKKTCCCSLRTCVLIMGWFSFIMSAIQVSGALYLAIICINCKNLAKVVFSHNKEDMEALTDHCELAYIHHLFYVLAGVGIIVFLCSLLLLCGVYCSKPALFMPYIIVFILAIIVDLTCSVWLVDDKHWDACILGIMTGVIALKFVLYIYILQCVFSYYHQMRVAEIDKATDKEMGQIQ